MIRIVDDHVLRKVSITAAHAIHQLEHEIHHVDEYVLFSRDMLR